MVKFLVTLDRISPRGRSRCISATKVTPCFENLPDRTRSRERISLLSRRSCPPGLVASIYSLLIGYVLSISGLPNRKSRGPDGAQVVCTCIPQCTRCNTTIGRVYGAHGGPSIRTINATSILINIAGWIGTGCMQLNRSRYRGFLLNFLPPCIFIR